MQILGGLAVVYDDGTIIMPEWLYLSSVVAFCLLVAATVGLAIKYRGPLAYFLVIAPLNWLADVLDLDHRLGLDEGDVNEASKDDDHEITRT